MRSIPVNIGLDYHTDSIQVSIMDASGQQLVNRSVPNDASKVAELSRPYEVRAIALEACTGAANLADELVDRWGFEVYLAHSGTVSRLKQSPDKSDYSDARLLADLVRVGYLPRIWHAPRWIRALRSLVRYRQSLVRERRATKLRVRALLREQRIKTSVGRAWTNGWLQWLKDKAPLDETGRWVLGELLESLEHLDAKIQKAEQRLRDQVADDPFVGTLMTHRGIGLVIACTVRAEIGRFDRFRRPKQASNFCGLSPRNASSGGRMADAGLLHQANGDLRAVILQGAHLLKRHDPRWRGLAQQMRARGKHGSVIVAAIANRWMRGLHQQFKHMGLAEPLKQAA